MPLIDDLARMVAHEVRNILTPAHARAQLALDHPGDVRVTRQALIAASLAFERITRITAALLQREPAQVETVAVLPLLHEAIELCTPHIHPTPAIELECDPELVVVTSPTALRHILVNLIANAVQAGRVRSSHSRVSVKCSTGNTRQSALGAIVIEIEDSGHGLPIKVLNSINQVADADSGCSHPDQPQNTMVGGVGLIVAANLCESLGAELAARNHPGGGAVVTIRVPDRRSNYSRAA